MLKLWSLFKRNSSSSTLSSFSLFRYASKSDVILMVIGICCTFAKAIATSSTIILYCEFTSLFVERTYGIGTSSRAPMLSLFGGGRVLTNATTEENQTEIRNDAIAYVLLMSLASCAALIGGIIGVDCFNRAAISQIKRIRCKYFHSLMRQEIGWYDLQSRNTNFAVRIIEDIEKIKNGINENVVHFLNIILGFTFNLLMAFAYGWKLTLVVISYIPIVLITNIWISKFQAVLSRKELDGYAAAANIAEEVLSGIRTVFAFAGEEVEVERYNKRLSPAKSASRRIGMLSGIGDGILRLLYFGTAALIFWFGVQWVLEDRDKDEKEYTVAVLMIVYFGIAIGNELISKASPHFEIFATARGSATTVFQVIERKPKIDCMLFEKEKDMKFDVKGSIKFKNIYFSYPSRPDVQILKDFNLTIEAGKSIALVGSSGNGKSTCLHLLQRFYDPDMGKILIDGCNIRSMNIDQLRSKIALVGQEPVLFSTTIGENIRYGKPDATDKDIVAAAKSSGAHDFISLLPLGYDTLVGEKGSQLSGGQKQRIAIARALIQNPQLLLLDEATSALDYQSEKFVQETLDKASKGRTTIVVSHRLSAIRNADRILFIDKGQVVEDGTHNELLELKGRYFDMVLAGGMEDELETATSQVNLMHVYNKTAKKSNYKELFDNMNDYQYHFHEISVSNDKPKIGKNIDYTHNFIRILKLVKEDWGILFIAVVCAIIIGTNMPLFSIFFAQVYGILSIRDPDEAMDEILVLVLILMGLGVVMFLAAILQTFFFSKAGGKLTIKLRSMTFASMLKQECGWFDDQNNSVGALSARLSGDAAHVQGAVGYPLSVILQSISTVISGFTVGFFYSWKLSLVCVLAIPMIIICVYFEAKHMSKSEIAEKVAIEAGIKIATEACSNIRTVASLRQEPHMISRFITEMNKVEQIVRKKTIWRGLVTSLNQTIPLLAYVWAPFYGGMLIANGEVSYIDVIRVCQAILSGTFVMTLTLVFAPAFTTALVAADRVFKTIDRQPQIQSPVLGNKNRIPDKKNDIKFEQIDFRYPTRPDIQILNNFNLNILEGKTVALVGPSGCGKSTCIQLLQRFYDFEYGRIRIGLDEISRDIPLNDLRSKLSIVSQEPVLFDKTIAENIAYGDNTRNVSMAEIIKAAKTANVHNFIVQLPNGYDTNLGTKGALLSGGQKQRIAIARALIRNPKILLLDEATSALDLYSEQVVQQALDTARTGRTCIVIAHRLSTVQNADLICVMKNGSIVEAGIHSQLLALNGFYTRLYNAQK